MKWLRMCLVTHQEAMYSQESDLTNPLQRRTGNAQDPIAGSFLLREAFFARAIRLRYEAVLLFFLARRRRKE